MNAVGRSSRIDGVAAPGAEGRRDAACDLVLLDPPYDIDPDTLMQVLEVAASRITADGLLVLERARRRESGVPDVLTRVRDVASGDSVLTLFCRV